MRVLHDPGEIGQAAPHFSTSHEIWKPEFRLSEFLAPMRLREIEERTDGNNSSWINLRMRHVVMTFDVIEIDGVGDAWLLI